MRYNVGKGISTIISFAWMEFTQLPCKYFTFTAFNRGEFAADIFWLPVLHVLLFIDMILLWKFTFYRVDEFDKRYCMHLALTCSPLSIKCYLIIPSVAVESSCG